MDRQHRPPSQRLCAVIHGPNAREMTLHAPRLCTAFGLDKLVVDWSDAQPLTPGAIHLAATTGRRTTDGVLVLDYEAAYTFARLQAERRGAACAGATACAG